MRSALGGGAGEEQSGRSSGHWQWTVDDGSRKLRSCTCWAFRVRTTELPRSPILPFTALLLVGQLPPPLPCTALAHSTSVLPPPITALHCGRELTFTYTCTLLPFSPPTRSLPSSASAVTCSFTRYASTPSRPVTSSAQWAPAASAPASLAAVVAPGPRPRGSAPAD